MVEQRDEDNSVYARKLVCSKWRLFFQVWVWGDNSGGQGGPTTTTTTSSSSSSSAPSPSKSPSKSPNRMNTPASSITSPRRLNVFEEGGGGLVRDLASGDNYLIVITVDGLTYYIGKLRYCLKNCTYE